MLAPILSALVVAGLAAAASERSPGTRTLAVGAAVRELAADSTRAAMLLGSSHSCSVLLWDAHTRRRVAVRERCSGSPRDGTNGIAIGGARAIWIQTAGGNLLESQLRTATPAKQRPVTLAFVGADPDGEGSGTYLGNLRGEGSRFFFRMWETCSIAEGTAEPCPPGLDSGDVVRSDIWTYAPGGSGACPSDERTPPRGCRVIVSGASDIALVAADRTRVALRLPSGAVELRNAKGALLQAFPIAPGRVDVALTANRLLVRRGTSLQVFDTQTGATGIGRTVPVGATLVGAKGGLALLLGGRVIYLVRLSDARLIRVAVPGTGRVRAQLGATGLFYSYIARRGRIRGRLALLPRAALLRRFG